MAMRYANEADVLAQLKLDPESGDDDAAIDRVTALEEGLCLTMDQKLGRSFGTAPVAETRSVVVGPMTGYGWSGPLWPMDLSSFTSSGSPRLILDVPLRSVTGIETGGTWNGTGWDDGETLTADQYRITNQTNQGFYAIDLVSGTWGGVVRITGIWGDQDTEDVPADIREAMTFVVAETYRMQQASPADQIGPDGMIVNPRNPWKYEFVVQAIDRHQLVKVLV